MADEDVGLWSLFFELFFELGSDLKPRRLWLVFDSFESVLFDNK